MATAVLVPGSYEPEPDEQELAKGLSDIELYLQSATIERVSDVGRGIIALEEQGVPRGIGRVAASPFIMPAKQQLREVSPGVYYF